MDSIKFGVLVVLILNVLLFLVQIGAEKAATDARFQMYNYDESLMSKYDKGGYVLDEDIIDKLPSDEDSVSPTTGETYTDSWKAVKTWLLDNTGITYLWGIINAVPNMLKIMGLDKELVFALGFLWQSFQLFLLIMFLRGGE